MKYISLFLLFFIISITLNKSFAEDALTIKQQLDRITEEIKDLNKAVFNKSFDNKKLNSLVDKFLDNKFAIVEPAMPLPTIQKSFIHETSL